jgi:hypothetical protein
MTSLSNQERVRALQALGVWCQMKLTGTEPTKAVLDSLNFNSIEGMKIQLNNWGAPDWVLQEEPSGENRRKARSGSGQRQELPPADEATPLFRQALELLNEQVDLLEARKEYMQDERFVAQDEHHAPIFWTRPHGMSDEDWKVLCEKVGQSSNSDCFALWDTPLVEPAGATQSPPEPLTTLIAVYLLAGLPPEPLLDKLHFAPETVDTAEIERHLETACRKRSVGRMGRLRRNT